MSQLLALDIDGARRLTERIRLLAGNVADNVEKLRNLVGEAKESQVHQLLGYQSWTAYLRDVFGDEPLRLARDVRQELVTELAAQGMSTRAIAPIVGVTHMQVSRDIREEAPVTNVTPDRIINVIGETGEVVEEPRQVTGLDGKTYKPVERKAVKPSAEVTILNDVRLYLRALTRSPQIARLSDAGKQHLIDALNEAVNQVEGTRNA